MRASTTSTPSATTRPVSKPFLQQVALFSDQDAIEDDDGQITLMTLHNAKGLEFPVVFMIGLEEGVFPHSRAVHWWRLHRLMCSRPGRRPWRPPPHRHRQVQDLPTSWSVSPRSWWTRR